MTESNCRRLCAHPVRQGEAQRSRKVASERRPEFLLCAHFPAGDQCPTTRATKEPRRARRHFQSRAHFHATRIPRISLEQSVCNALEGCHFLLRTYSNNIRTVSA